ncbi:hypothetical protein VOLCADRAFT_105879 [Volvox carteri f. nagariensis]|uniref:Uncharacterized protein n=1 Tax=Volvox carteri f. nagariensis TaxID=3068 RepID=D8U3U1_VOLCA|nr:uncharacterized protein VOLCADRAFT_105879 [Volvox carteri f. nagariensis]EFJ45670.1 hypothetical protein VOLCADRAFT_105879 [Volvox carteri f. nagariensis]|eukprot:XP_002953360.1 hypothetical protein VOLCADRAFT_105879 [Volvox carteri f. nagariensis]
MARSIQCIGLAACVLAAQYVAAQEILSKLIVTDALFNGAKKDAIHSHLQRMLQLDSEREESETLESCSPAALLQDRKCTVQIAAGLKLASKTGIKSSVESKISAPMCKGSDCLNAPMPNNKGSSGSESVEVEGNEPATKLVTYGPMTQDAYQRMVQRKRAAKRDELQKKGALTPELDAFLKSSNAGELKDAFGIPLPAAPTEPRRPRDDFEMRFQPQTPSPDPAIRAPSSSKSSSPSDTSSSKASSDFEMRFQPQSPAMEPGALRQELEAFIAASPVAQHMAHSTASFTTTSTSTTTTSPSAPASSTAENAAELKSVVAAAATLAVAGANVPHQKPSLEDPLPLPAAAKTLNDVAAAAAAAAVGPARPPMTKTQAEAEAAAAAQQVAANTAAAREANLERKRQLVREEAAAAAANKKNAAKRTGSSSSSSPLRGQHKQEQQRRGSGSTTPTTTPSASTKYVHAMRSAPGAPRPISSSSPSVRSKAGVTGYLFVALLAVAAAVGLFVAAAVMEDALLARPSGVKNGAAVATAALPGQWLVLTRGLWRRCRRAFAAARKQLMGHGSDLPMSVNEGSSPVARAVAAASAFVHVFWMHFRHQQLSGAVTAALDASRRASAGGGVASFVPDRASAGGAAAATPASVSSYQPYITSPFAAPLYQQSYGAAAMAASSTSYVIESDVSAAVTVDGNLRRRH